VREQLPVIKATIESLAEWIDTHPSQDLPRAIGSHAFTLQRGAPLEATSERAIFPFDQWMFQRPQDCFWSLAEADRSRVRTLLAKVGAEHALDQLPRHRLVRRNFQLVVSAAT
jgi:hypothetical protein